MKAPWMRAPRDSEAGRNSMSPWPSSDSAPFWSRITRESVWEDTAKAMRDDQEKCLAAGANDYLAKPIDIEKLLSLVRVWMPK